MKNARAFYLTFPEVSQPVAQYLVQHFGKSQSLPDFFLLHDFQAIKKSQALPDLLQPNVEVAEISRDGFAMQTTKGEVIPEDHGVGSLRGKASKLERY